MLFIQQFIQNIFLRFRILFGPLTSVYMRLRVYMRPGQAIRNQFAGVTARWSSVRSRFASFTNAILPERFRKRLGLGKSSRRGGSGDESEAEFGELSARKARRLSGGRKLKPLQMKAQFSQVHLINDITGKRKIAHIGKKVDRSWTEMFVEIDEDHSVRLSYTIVDKAVYGSDVAITYERGDVEIVVDGQELTQQISLPIYNESVVTIAGVPYVVDLFAYEALPIKTRVDASWLTNVGPVRDDNQDAIGIYQHDEAYMFTIADGVGGGYAGDVVSEYSVKYLLKTFQKNIEYTNLSWIQILRKAYQHCNAEVRKFVERSPYAAGTTLTTVVIREWTAYIAHVGDSRVYHLRGIHLNQLTDDHREQHRVKRTTQYQHLPDEYLPMRDVLVRAIGKRDAIDPQIITMALQPGDKLLMITDGVTHQVSDEEIYNILITESIDDAPKHLIALANERENTDNASVILLDVMEEAFEQDIWEPVQEERVFVGGKNWRLDLKRPHDMSTQYEVPNQVGCLTMIVVMLACAFIWWGLPRVIGGVGDEPAGIVEPLTEEATGIVEPTLMPTQTNDAQASTLPDVSATAEPMDATRTTLDSMATQTVQPTLVPTDVQPSSTPSSTPTPYESPTPFPTLPPLVGPTSTQIPPTSTLRA